MIPRKFLTSCLLNTARRFPPILNTSNERKNAVSFCTLDTNSIKFPSEASTLLLKSLTIHMPRFCSNFPTTNDSSHDEKRIMLTKWIEMCRFEGEYVPQEITEEQFQYLLNAKGIFQRKKYLSFLCKKEYASKNDKIRAQRKKELKRKLREEGIKQNLSHLTYGLWRNSMFAKTNDQTIGNFYSHRLSSAMIHGQPLVLDLGFEDHMRGREISSLAEQILISIGLNRSKPNPFNLTICNADFESETIKSFNKRMPNVINSNFPMNVSSQNYLDIFPKEKLVYLTPNAREEMTKFDSEAIYIVGGIVDLGNKEPLTLAKAKKERIKMQKLPLDRFHLFRHNKSLGIHVVIGILLDLQETGNWKESFENIPRRLIQSGNERHSRWDNKRSVFR